MQKTTLIDDDIMRTEEDHQIEIISSHDNTKITPLRESASFQDTLSRPDIVKENRRGRGRPRILFTGCRGRPRRLFSSCQENNHETQESSTVPVEDEEIGNVFAGVAEIALKEAMMSPEKEQ